MIASAVHGVLAFSPLAPGQAQGINALLEEPDATGVSAESAANIVHGYLGVFIIAFLVTIFATPVMRMLAIANGVVDNPGDARKTHRIPVAYLGGAAVFVGVLAGIAYSYIGLDLPSVLYSEHESVHELSVVPLSILIGMSLIALTGLIDDVVGLAPRLKIAGQLLAAAALAMEEVGTNVAAGVMRPIGAMLGNANLTWAFDLGANIPVIAPSGQLEVDLIYWTGTAIIAVFVLGACNASNLIDGLDGLLSGVTAIVAAALLVIALMLAEHDDGSLDGARIVIVLAMLGGCLGFLPHNFRPATIFLGDCGSLLLGYLAIVAILTLGDTGKTHLVVAGLIIYSIPIIDTVLAIVRRKMAGRSMSDADDQHLHHMLKRALGVPGAVLTLYGIGALFGVLGVALSMGRVRLVFTIALVVWGFIGVTAVKVARRQAIEAKALARVAGHPTRPGAIAKHERDEERAHAPASPAPARSPEQRAATPAKPAP